MWRKVDARVKTMLRRLYLLFPGVKFATRAVADLESLGVERAHIHTIAKDGVDISHLPRATTRQRLDFAARLDHWFWDANLLVFFIALLLLPLMAWFGNWPWAIVMLAIMGATYLFGSHFARHLPHVHLEECLTAIRHGEVLLLVDLPLWRLPHVERAIRREHPEMELGGVGWTLDALGI